MGSFRLSAGRLHTSRTSRVWSSVYFNIYFTCARTLEELFEIWVGRYLDFHNKPVVILDPYNLYEPLHSLVVHLENHNFVKPGMRELVHWSSSVEDAVAHAQKN